MGIIVGLGSGRSGTVSLARLINAQDQSVCFHEINPACMAWTGTPGPVFSMLREFKEILHGGARDRVTLDLTSPERAAPLQRLIGLADVTTIGEVGFYYLNYVEQIIAEFPDVKFPCLRRDKTATVRSFVAKMRVAGGSRAIWPWSNGAAYRNPFVAHPGETWVPDVKWDKCYPKYQVDSLEEAVGLFWDAYYTEAERLSGRYPQVRIFDLEELNEPQAQTGILEFCGISSPRNLDVHENRIRSA